MAVAAGPSSGAMTNRIVDEDMEAIFRKLSPAELEKLRGSTVLLTGCGGFLGFYFMHFFARFASALGIKRVTGLENFLTGSREWLEKLAAGHRGIVELREFNIISDDLNSIPGASNADLVIHMASIASPVFYRKYPIETVDANVTGLRRLLDFYSDRKLRGSFSFRAARFTATLFGIHTNQRILSR